MICFGNLSPFLLLDYALYWPKNVVKGCVICGFNHATFNPVFGKQSIFYPPLLYSLPEFSFGHLALHVLLLLLLVLEGEVVQVVELVLVLATDGLQLLHVELKVAVPVVLGAKDLDLHVGEVEVPQRVPGRGGSES